MDFQDFIQKRSQHLLDLPPIEPLPPLENALEMTQNHQEWVRGVEDFKIEHEKLEEFRDMSALVADFSLTAYPTPALESWDSLQQNSIGIDKKLQVDLQKLRFSTLHDNIDSFQSSGFLAIG